MSDWNSVQYLDMTAKSSKSAGTGISVAYLFTKRPPTVCGFLERGDTGYYCIRSWKHDGRHRYGRVIEGWFRER